MAGLLPAASYALRIPPGDILVPVVPGFQATARITMAAIDPSEEPELENAVDKQKVRSTLKVIRLADDEDDSEDEDFEEDDEEDEEDSDGDDAESNGGPSTKIPSKKDIAKALIEAEEEEDEDDDEEEDDSEDDAAAEALLAKLMKDAKKGKSKAVDGEVDDSEDDDTESLEMDEVVVCTLDPEKAYQQPLDLVIAEGEKVFFKVSGNLTVHITGNYMMPIDDLDDEEDEEGLEDYGEDELDALDALADGADESDELDDLEDPRVMEVDSEEEETKPKLLPASAGKGKNKRPAEDSAEEDVSLDNIMAKSLKQEESDEPKKLTKAEKKKQKKLKNNEGEPTAAPQANGTTPDSGKKTVQFAKNLEQGPTPSAKTEIKTETKANTKADKADAKPDTKADAKKSVSLGVKNVKGVTIDDRKIGTGPAAKKGSKVEMRYIGKLKDGKVFDANKSGKPFSFKLGSGEVIQGWDIGIAGMSAGGERRLTVPAHLGYGKQKSGPIPANSELTFDVKCISVK